MAARQGVPRQPSEHDDFVGEGRYRPLGPGKFCPTSQNDAPPPPSIEIAILMAVGEVVEHRQPGFCCWDDPDSWTNTTWPRPMAAYLLWEMTVLDLQEISDLLGCSAGTIYNDRKYMRAVIQRAAQPQHLSQYSKQLVNKLWVAIVRTEELAQCSIMWLDGVDANSQAQLPKISK